MMELGIAVLILLFVSALASGTEAALFAVPLARVENFIDEKRRGASALKMVKEDMVQTITTVVIINNIANIHRREFTTVSTGKIF